MYFIMKSTLKLTQNVYADKFLVK